jgi:hypothetical protein
MAAGSFMLVEIQKPASIAATLLPLSDSPGLIAAPGPPRNRTGTFSASGSSKPLRSEGGAPRDPLSRLERVVRGSVPRGVGRGV